MLCVPAHPCVFVHASVCASLCGNINRPYACIPAYSPLPALLCSCFVVLPHNHLCLLISLFSDFFCFSACEYTNLHLCFFFPPGGFTSAYQRKCIHDEVVGWRSEEKRENRTGRSGKGGGGGRWQVDYGRRSRCLETAGTRDARLLGDRHDAMTSSVWWSGGEAKTENCLCALRPTQQHPPSPSSPPPPPPTLPPRCKCSWKSREMVSADIFTMQSGCVSEQRSRMDEIEDKTGDRHVSLSHSTCSLYRLNSTRCLSWEYGDYHQRRGKKISSSVCFTYSSCKRSSI